MLEWIDGLFTRFFQWKSHQFPERNQMATENCDACVNYVYDEDYECYCCLVNLDEDEMYRFLSGTQRECPYFRLDDEYGVVRHQI